MPQPPFNALAAKLRRLLESKAVDGANLFLVSGNFIFLVCNNFDASAAFLLAYAAWSAGYLAVICLELLLSLCAYGVRLCTSDAHFLMDVLVVVWSVGATYMTGKLKFAISLMRVFRLPGLLERLGLWRKSDMYTAMMETLKISIPKLVKIAWLLLIVIYVFAALCVQVLGNVKTNSRISHTARFHDMWSAFKTVMTISLDFSLSLSLCICVCVCLDLFSVLTRGVPLASQLFQIIFGDEWCAPLPSCLPLCVRQRACGMHYEHASPACDSAAPRSGTCSKSDRHVCTRGSASACWLPCD